MGAYDKFVKNQNEAETPTSGSDNPYSKFNQKTPEDAAQTNQHMSDYAAVGERLRNMMRNYPEDYANVIKSIPELAKMVGSGVKQLATHPIETSGKLAEKFVEGVALPAAGAIEKNVDFIPKDKETIEKYEQFKKQFKNSSYGSLENFADYIEKNPVQAQADMAMLLSGAGGAAKLAGAKNIGEAVMKAGALVEPLAAPIRAGRFSAKTLIPSSFAKKLYASSAKMQTVMNPVERDALAQKLLDADVKLNLKGFTKLSNDFESLWRGVDDKIDEYVNTGPNQKVTVDDLLKNLDDLDERAKNIGYPKLVDNIKDRFRRGHDSGGAPKQLDMRTVNRIKRDLYNELNKKYTAQTNAIADKVRMKIAHNAMETIEQLIPGVVPDNKTAAAYKELMGAIEKGVNRIENRDLLGLGLPVRTGVGAIASREMGLSERAGGIIGLILGVIDTPSVKSRVALRLNKLKKSGANLNITPTAVRLGLVKGAGGVQDAERETNYERIKRISELYGVNDNQNNGEQ